MTPTPSTAPRASSLPLVAAAGLSGVLVAAALALWACYGSAVFLEMIAAGVRACF